MEGRRSDISELVGSTSTNKELAISTEGILKDWRERLVPMRKSEWLEAGDVEMLLALKDAEAAIKIHKARMDERAKMKAILLDFTEGRYGENT